MLALAGGPALTGSPQMNWSRLFALQPEPDLEFTEEELEQTVNIRSASPMKPPKKSGGRPLLWIVLLALVGSATYVAMEPEMMMDVLAPLLGEESLSRPSPSATARPAPSMPAPGAPASPLGPAGPPAATTVPPVPAQQAAVPTPGAGMPTPATVPPAPAMPKTPATTETPVAPSPIPMFGEGQKVTVALDPTMPGDTVTLMQDAAGTKPGPAIRPGMTLTILDGDLQSSGWVYSVRSDDGAKGWVLENRLRLKP
jgi:hypothetical protein